MRVRKFNQESDSTDPRGVEALNLFRAIKSDQERYRYPGCSVDANVVVQAPYETVWQLLLETQHFSYWMKGGRCYREGYSMLPMTFGRGTAFGPNSFILDCVQEEGINKSSRLTLQDSFYSDTPPVYYTFELTPYERYSTRVSVIAEYRHYPYREWWVFIRKLLNLNTDDSQYLTNVKKEIGRHLGKAVKRFANFCWDRSEYGPVEIHYDGTWRTWEDYEPDRLHYYKNGNGHVGPEIGEFIKESEHIGFVYPTGAPEPLDQWKAGYYVNVLRSGYVRRILKNHNDQLQDVDRILLVTENLEDDLSTATLDIEQYIKICSGLDSSKYRDDPKIIKVHANKGDKIQQGEVLLTVEDRNGRQFNIPSIYCGLVAEMPMKDGEKISSIENYIFKRIKIKCQQAK